MVPPYSHRVSRVRRYSGFLLCILCFRLRDFHSVSSAFPYRSTSFFARCVSPNPEKLSPSVWPLPRSLATTCGISVDFSSSSYLDVSVQTVPRVRLFYSTHADRFFTCRVAPFGYPRIDAYVPLPVAFRSLSRPSSAPDAKASSLRPSSLDLSQTRESCKSFGSHKIVAYPFTVFPQFLASSVALLALFLFRYSVFKVRRTSRRTSGGSYPLN